MPWIYLEKKDYHCFYCYYTFSHKRLPTADTWTIPSTSQEVELPQRTLSNWDGKRQQRRLILRLYHIPCHLTNPARNTLRDLFKYTYQPGAHYTNSTLSQIQKRSRIILKDQRRIVESREHCIKVKRIYRARCVGKSITSTSVSHCSVARRGGLY